MYTYYAKFEADEHMLLAKEIAAAYGIFTKNDKPNTLLVGKILHRHIESRDAMRMYYYSGQLKNLLEVYSSIIYVPAMRDFLAKAEKPEGAYFIDGKNYYYKIVLPPVKTEGTKCEFVVFDEMAAYPPKEA